MEGTIKAIQGQVVEIEFSDGIMPKMHDTVAVVDHFEGTSGLESSLLLEVHGYLEHGRVQAVALGSTSGLKRNVKVTKVPESESPVSSLDLRGNIIDGVGNFILRRTPSSDSKNLSRFVFQGSGRAPKVVKSPLSNEVMPTRIKAIDLLAPIAKGSMTGILGGAGVGKTELMRQILQNFLSEEVNENRVVVFAGVGERIREAHELYYNLDQQFIDKSVFVFGQMDKSAGERFRTAHTALSIAEDYRDHHYHVLLFMDNLFRFVQAGAELSTMFARMPSVLGYQPTLESELGNLLDRICSYEGETGCITSIQCVYMPADDLTDPAVNEIYRHLDTVIVLDRELTKETPRFYPAIDPLRSQSDAKQQEFKTQADSVRQILRRKNSLCTKSKYGLTDSLEDDFLNKAENLRLYFKQSASPQLINRNEINALIKSADEARIRLSDADVQQITQK